MTVFRSLAEIRVNQGSVVAIGNFDGVHIGHREILRRVIAVAHDGGLTPTVLTFDPHPARVLAPDRAPSMIMTIDQRLRAFERAGVETTFVLPFSLEFARLSPAEFAGQVLVQALRTRCVLVGDDFRFGYKQSGNVGTLIELGHRLGFAVQPVAPVLGDRERVSSTAIRQLISKGRVSKACRMMVAPFALEGAVVRGFGIGSKQTVPTLNLAAENELLPGTGVYVTRTRDEASGRSWNSITNVGYRPTFEGRELTVETFLLDPAPASAPERIEVQFLSRIREERRFETPEALKAQILRDAGAAMRFHRRLTRLNVG